MMTKKLFLCVTMLLLSVVGFAQKTVNGTVSDATGPLPGVSVIEKGTTNGVETNFDGNFTLQVKDNNSILVFSFIGAKTQEISVSGKTNIQVVLEEDSEQLEEVVITAQGIKKSKKALGYAITKVESKEISQRPEADLARTLQGKIAGVSIGNASGQTGSSSPIRIRGSISLTQVNSPLIVVNNVPFNGVLRDIDPNDIQSMSVLKGFNASVLYGSEGRNGVILIQTKSGNAKAGENKTRVSFSTTTYVNTVSQLPEYQNTYGVGQDFGYVLGLANFGPKFSDLNEVAHPYASLSVFPQYANEKVSYSAKPNNVRNIFRDGTGRIFSANITTSKEKLAYSMSVGYTNEKGIVENNDLKRFNIGLGGNAQITDKLHMSATLNYSTRAVNRIQSLAVFNRVFYLPRNIDLTELPYQNPNTGASVYYRNDNNPLWVLNNAGIQDDLVKVFGTVNTNFKLSDDINLNYRIGYDNQNSERFDYSNKGGFSGDYRLGYLNIDNIKEEVIDQTFIVGYNKDLTDDLSLEAQVGANSKVTKQKTTFSDSRGQIVYDFLRPKNYVDKDIRYRTEKQNIAGVFGQFQFAYKKYLYATLSARNDWGSTVESQNRSLFYPGASISFIPTSAFDFGEDSFVNYLKVRGAYATSSGFPEAYRTRNTLLIDTNRFTTSEGVTPVTNRFSSIYGNPDLKPELHKEFEVGLETKLFNNRLNLEASFYKRVSEDQIVASPLPLTSGRDIRFINLGRVDNEGLEIDLGIDIFKNDEFSWNTRNIFTKEKSLVVKTTETGERIRLSADRFAVEGFPINSIVGSYALRDNKGNLLIKGTGGSNVIGQVLDNDDIGAEDKVIGNPNPDWRFTNINSISYKNFNFSTQIEYTHGGEISSRAIEDLLERGVTRDTENREGSFVIPGFLANHTTGEPLLDPNGDKIPNTIQMNGHRLSLANYYNPHDLRMWDASVFRIREISLGYSFKGGKGKKFPFEKLDLTLSGRNLWYIAPNFPKYTNFDPESDGGLGRSSVPSTKRIALGISITF